MSSTIKILIAAMGGEGGGVLCKLLTEVSEAHGHIVHYTYVPGAAQRTGATTYYLEIHRPNGADPRQRPLSTLIPGPGDMDLVLCTEIVEAGRCLSRGFVTPDKTMVISSTHRTFAIAEKSVPGDGRIDHQAVLDAVRTNARRFIGFDMADCARQAGGIVNAVLLGAVAASGALPFAREAYEKILATGPAAKANLAGFALGFDRTAATGDGDASPVAPAETRTSRVGQLPEPVRAVADTGWERVAAYQNERYAICYLRRVQEMIAFEDGLDATPGDYALSREVARWLVRLMCYDDVARVADLKTRRDRFERIRAAVKAGPEDMVRIEDFLKPRAEEIAGLMPPWLARPFRAVTAGGTLDRHGRPLRLKVHTVSGFLTLRLIAWLKWMRPYSVRFASEDRMVETWLSAVRKAAAKDYALAVEMAGLARLIKGYGPTHCQSQENFNTILERWESMPTAADLKRLKDAALAEEKGRALARELVENRG